MLTTYQVIKFKEFVDIRDNTLAATLVNITVFPGLRNITLQNHKIFVNFGPLIHLREAVQGLCMKGREIQGKGKHRTNSFANATQMLLEAENEKYTIWQGKR